MCCWREQSALNLNFVNVTSFLKTSQSIIPGQEVKCTETTHSTKMSLRALSATPSLLATAGSYHRAATGGVLRSVNRRRQATLFCFVVLGALFTTIFISRQTYEAQQQQLQLAIGDRPDDGLSVSPRRLRLTTLFAPLTNRSQHFHNYRPSTGSDEDAGCAAAEGVAPRLRRGLRFALAQHRCAHRNATPTPLVPTTRKRSTSQCRPPHGYGLDLSRESSTPSSSPYYRLLPNQSYAREFSEILRRTHLPKDITDVGHEQKSCVVYTVFAGHYEKTLKPFVNQTVDCYWIAFTDRKNLSGAPGWLVKPIPAHLRERHYTSLRHRGYVITKFIKMLPFLLFPSWIQHAIYIDATYNVTNETFAARAIEDISANNNAPIALLRHPSVTSTGMELDLAAIRYEGVGTLDALLKQFIAHVAEGMCDNWFDLADEEVLSPPDPVEQVALHRLSAALRRAYCAQTPETSGLSMTMGRRFLQHKGKLRYPCRRQPPQNSALPHLPEELLRAMPSPGPHTSLYDSSMIAYRLNHPHSTTRKFAEEFLKQWYRDASLHGKDQLPLMMLLWRTPGYFPAVLSEPFQSHKGTMVFRNEHGV